MNATAATTTAAATTATAATAGFLNAGLAGVFLVEEMERRQADVGDFFLTERDGLTGNIVWRLLYVR